MNFQPFKGIGVHVDRNLSDLKNRTLFGPDGDVGEGQRLKVAQLHRAISQRVPKLRLDPEVTCLE